MTQIKGIDVSHWQGNIDWQKVAADGVQFVFIKATEGTTYFDPTFNEYAAGAKANGIHLGTYHYAKFSNVAEAQAEVQYFLGKIAGISFDYPVVLDLEENKKGASQAELTDAAVVFLRAIEKAGYFAMIYTGEYFMSSALDASKLAPFAKWIAHYGGNLIQSADIWQYTSTGRVNGINGDVDLNWAYRDFAPSKVEKPPVHIPSSVLKQGDKGADVIRLQKDLTRKGFVTTPDGLFGPKTTTQVKAFQKAKKLQMDGIVGPQTWKALES
ncbi:GH25 family lysozyme [Aneurinibacillus tyrosinisolvens]|uniref:GH25 family lysozyme n=1 Tax=Aneurinibacillus tyrosinisolvens TaxID=1443435 RepID=UPI00069C8A63|nr:GH25 family lysozyme [Aneurinibacillus tyrosinisolvens]